VQCIADDLYLIAILDKNLKFKTHSNHTPMIDIKACEEPIIKKQCHISRAVLVNNVPFTIKRHNRFNEVNGKFVCYFFVSYE